MIILWHVRKRRGKTPKKRWLVIPVSLLVMGVIAALLPVGYIGFLRIANSANQKPAVYAASGITVYWPVTGKYSSTNTRFEMDGIGYVNFTQNISGEPFFLDYNEDMLGEPVANIKNDPSTSNAFNEWMTWLLTGSTSDKLNTRTIYPVVNDHGFHLYHISGFSDTNAFCPEEQIDAIKAYYRDMTNYDTQNVKIKYSVYTDGEGSGIRNNTPYLNVEKEMILAEGVFAELSQILEYKQNEVQITIPDSYKRLDEAATPGTPVFGYDERRLYAYSADRIAYRHILLVYIENRAYIELLSTSDYIAGYPLPDEMNQYIINTVFGDK